MPKISVIVPVYNTKIEYLKKCISSIIKQTMHDIEIIIIDDGSNNGIENVCDMYKKEDERIRVIHQTNKGVSEARNNGINMAESKWITFVDADDWLEENACEKMYAYTDDNADMIICRTYDNIENIQKTGIYNGKKIEKIKNIDEKEELLKNIFIDKNRKFPGLPFVTAKLLKKDIIKSKNIFFNSNLKYGEDSLFNLNYIYASREILFIDEIIYHYRINNESVTHTWKKEIIEYFNNTNKYMYNFLKDYNINNKEYIINYYIIKNLNIILDNYFSCNDDIRILKEILEKDNYNEAIKNIRIKDLPKKRKLLVIFARLKFYYGIKLLYKIKK